MKNKKGFTLIEIIMCIVLIVVIGTASFFGVKTIRKNIKYNKLEDFSELILNAVSIYIENNAEAKEQLYSSKNGVLVPLNVLKNEGLIDFLDIEITDEDYVITMLGSSSSSGACIDTTTIGSWEDGNKTIYLCTDSSGNTNISSVGFSGNNLSLTSKNRVYFYTNYLGTNYGIEASGEAKTNNYIKFSEKVYKIYYIDRDDSLVLLSFDSFGSTFNGKTQNISAYKRRTDCKSEYTNADNADTMIYSWSDYYYDRRYIINDTSELIERNGEVPIGFNELYSSKILFDKTITTISSLDDFKNLNRDWLCKTSVQGTGWRYATGYGFKNESKIFKIHLKPCMKITGGNGDSVNPYVLSDRC